MVDIDKLFEWQFLLSLAFSAILIPINAIILCVNKRGSRFTFISRIIILFIVCEIANIFLCLSDFYIVRTDQKNPDYH